MWSLGCILAEMIRGKPIFQGSSTINQIEKIVYTLPDITEHEIRSVGAGFGSVLLNKQVLKEKKITLNDILSGASGDALDLVKSLLVLDPMGRLTASQALNHTYVEKFRNSIPELELNVDILPPFRDDVRLTVPEYRTKLYEIVQTHGEKNKVLDNNKNSINTIRNRENKYLQNLHEKTEQKKVTRIKQHNTNMSDDNQQQSNINLSNPVNRTLKKTSSILKKSKSTKSINNIGDGIYNESKQIFNEERHLQRSKSHSHHHSPLHRQVIGDQLLDNATSEFNEINARRFSTNEQQNTTESLKRNNYTKRLHRSAIALNKNQNNVKSKMNHDNKHTQLPTVNNFIRHSKSEVIPLNNTPSSESSKLQERLCYERRLKKLEEEIERYKNEVKSFCRETFKNTKQKQQQEEMTNTKNVKCKNTPKRLTTTNITTGSTPIKNIYFQLLTKGQHRDYHKSDLDLSANSGNGSSSSDLFRNSYNSNSCSGRSKTSANSHNNKITHGQQNHQQVEQLTQQYHMAQKHQSQHRCRPISKFV